MDKLNPLASDYSTTPTLRIGPSAAMLATQLLTDFDEDQVLTLLCLAARYSASSMPDEVVDWDWDIRPELAEIGRICLNVQNSRQREAQP